MKQRVLAALVMAPLAITAILWLPTLAFAALVGAAMMVGAWEWLRLCGITARPVRAVVVALLAGVFTALWMLAPPALLLRVIQAGAAFWLLALLWLWRRDVARADTARNRALKLLAGALMFIPSWTALVVLHGQDARGPQWTLFALFLVWAADTFAYFAGSRIGGPKLVPSISPGKTWAGLWGGLVGALLVAAIGGHLLGVATADLPALLAAALLTILASVLGDLFESLIKRHSGAKDSGRLIPGHGGVLDRLDSVVSALPVFVVAIAWAGLR